MYQNVANEAMERTDSDGKSDGFTIPGDDILKARWQEVAECKVEADTIRRRIKRGKYRVDQARLERDVADNTFMSSLRPAQTDRTSLNTVVDTKCLQERFQQLQATRDAYQRKALVLVDLENNLVENEAKLDLLERRLINHLRHTTRGSTTREPVKVQVPEQSQSDLLKDLEIEPAKVSNPLYQRFLVALRSISLVREDRAELLARRAKLEERKRLLMIFEEYHPAALRYATPLEDRDIEFIIGFEREERRMSGEIDRWRKDAERLLQIAWESNLLPQHAPLEDVQSWYPGEVSIDEDLGYDHMKAASTEPKDFPILLSNPRHLLGDFPITAEDSLKRAARIPEGHPQRSNAIASAAKEVSIQNLVSDAEDMPNFINRWLLQSLRTSRLEVNALCSSYLASGDIGVFDIEKWQWDVLHNWWEDEAHMRTLEHFRPVQTLWASAPPIPPSWLSEPFLYTPDSEISEPAFEMTTEFEQSGGIDEANPRASGGAASLVTTKELEGLAAFQSENKFLEAFRPNDEETRPLLQLQAF